MAAESSSDKPVLAGRLVALVLIDCGHQATPLEYYRSRERSRDVYWPPMRGLDIDETPLRPF